MKEEEGRPLRQINGRGGSCQVICLELLVRARGREGGKQERASHRETFNFRRLCTWSPVCRGLFHESRVSSMTDIGTTKRKGPVQRTTTWSHPQLQCGTGSFSFPLSLSGAPIHACSLSPTFALRGRGENAQAFFFSSKRALPSPPPHTALHISSLRFPTRFPNKYKSRCLRLTVRPTTPSFYTSLRCQLYPETERQTPLPHTRNSHLQIVYRHSQCWHDPLRVR